jgi:hypothetical protein
MQFMNWTVVDTGTYDYASDTRGYTWGWLIDFVDRWWTFRLAEVLNSKRTNGTTLQKNLQDAYSENYELEFDPNLFAGRNSSLHILAFTNFANLGCYHSRVAFAHRIIVGRYFGVVQCRLLGNPDLPCWKHERGTTCFWTSSGYVSKPIASRSFSA